MRLVELFDQTTGTPAGVILETTAGIKQRIYHAWNAVKAYIMMIVGKKMKLLSAHEQSSPLILRSYRPVTVPNDVNEKVMCNMYRLGQSVAEISEKVDCDIPVVTLILQSNLNPGEYNK